MTDVVIIVLFLAILVGPTVIVEVIGRRRNRDSIGEVRPHLAIFDEKNLRRRR